jgi:hypothetical protein
MSGRAIGQPLSAARGMVRFDGMATKDYQISMITRYNLLWFTLVVLVGVLFARPAQADAPFCRVTNFGTENCWYYSLESCQRALTSDRSFCVRRDKETGDATVQPRSGPAPRVPLAPQKRDDEERPSAAPFCHVSRFGSESCWYYSLAACERRVESSGGRCLYNRPSED